MRDPGVSPGVELSDATLVDIVLKGEYITQKYNGYAPTSIFNGGKFHGLMIEGAVAF